MVPPDHDNCAMINVCVPESIMKGLVHSLAFWVVNVRINFHTLILQDWRWFNNAFKIWISQTPASSVNYGHSVFQLRFKTTTPNSYLVTIGIQQCQKRVADEDKSINPLFKRSEKGRSTSIL